MRMVEKRRSVGVYRLSASTFLFGVFSLVFVQSSFGRESRPMPGTLQVDLHRNDSQAFSSNIAGVGILLAEKGKRQHALPPRVVSDNAVAFYDFPGDCPYIADESEGTGKGYSLLWVDLDNNGAYEENEALPIKDGKFAFDWTVTDSGHRYNIKYKGSFIRWESKRPSGKIYYYIGLTTTAAFSGTLRVGEKSFTIVLADRDGDGEVSDCDVEERYHTGAQLSIMEDAEERPVCWFPLARTVAVFNRFYEPVIKFRGGLDDTSAQLTFIPREQATGTVRLTGTGVTSVLLAGDVDAFRLTPKDGHLLTVPEGSWSVLDVRITQDGLKYMPRSSYKLKRACSLTVTAGGTSDLALGGPLKHKLWVRCNLAGGDLTMLIPTDAWGVKGFRYISVSGGAAAMRWSVRRPGSQSTLASGTFEYG